MLKADGKYKLLRAIVNSRKASNAQLAVWAGCNVTSLQKKLSGAQKWWLDEAVGIKRGLGTNEPLERLFEMEEFLKQKKSE